MANRHPLARKDGLAMEPVQDELLVYDLDRNKAYCLNETAALVWKHCNGRRSAAEIAKRMKSDLGAPVDEKVVWFALDQLGRDQLLEKKAALPRALAGMTRREQLRALGKAAAIVVPLITTMVAPTPAQAASGCGGLCCQADKDCSPLGMVCKHVCPTCPSPGKICCVSGSPGCM